MAGNSKASVIAGVSANALITIGKFVGFFVSGSAALLSEAIHSVADTGNQSLLLLGLARSQKPPDPSHPYGYARDRFFWGLVSALGIFFLGAGVTLYHGIHGLMDPHLVHHTWLTWAVLGASLCIEGWAGLVALRGVRKDAKAADMGFFRYLREGRDPTIFAVLLEDTAAVIGVLMAALCIVLGEITGQAFWDPLASLLVGILLAVVAVVLVMQNRQFLTIRAVDRDVQDRIKRIMEAQDTVASIGGFRAVMLGVDTFHVSAGVRFKGDMLAARVLGDADLAAMRAASGDDAQLRAWAAAYSQRLAEEMGREVDDIERKVREVFPMAERIQLETKG